MVISTSPTSQAVAAHALATQHHARLAAKRRLDAAIVRYDAWFLVFVAVILALGASIAAGMAVWCVVKQHKTFTGRWSFKDFGLKVYFECR